MKSPQDAQEDKKLSIEKSISELEDYFIESRSDQIYRYVIDEVERPLIEKALERTYGNQIKAAKLLGINRNTLRSKIKRLGIQVDRWKF